MGSPYAEYPRGTNSGTGGPFRGQPRGAIDLGAFGEAWEMLKGNWAPFVLATLCVGLVYSAVFGGLLVQVLSGAGLFNGSAPDPVKIATIQLPIILLAVFVGGPISGIGYAGLVSMCLALLRGEVPTFNTFFQNSKRFPVYALVGLVYQGIIAVCGLVPCIGGLVAGGFLLLTGHFAVDKGLDPLKAPAASFRALKSEWLMAIVLYLLIQVCIFLGSVLCGIGALFAVPLCVMVMTIVYRDLVYVGLTSAPTAPMSPPPAEPPSDTPPPPEA